MLGDISTVMWKERKGLFQFRGSRTRFGLTLLMPLILAIQGPLRDGPRWVQREDPVILSAMISVILVLLTVPDSFAGERERHTLGTLLASRLPDRAILFGKVILSVSFAWGATLIVLSLSVLTVNIAYWDGELLFFSRTVAIASLTTSFLLTLLSTGAGILISLRSATVQEAAQFLTAVFFVPPMLLTVALVTMKDQMSELIGNLSGEQVMLVIALIMVVLNVGVYTTVMARFQRSRLSLD